MTSEDFLPGEPDDAELARLATTLRSQRRVLSDEAMARVERAMADEMDAAQRRARRGWFLRRFSVLAAAAAAVIGVGVYLQLHPKTMLPPAPPGKLAHRSTAPAADSFTVHFTRPPASLGDGPLVCLDRYQSLYTDRR